MSSSNPILEGRSGNLTPEEELKLKEFWSQILIYIGSAPKDLSTSITSTSIGSNSSSATNHRHHSHHHPGKRRGFLGFGGGKDKYVDDAVSQANHLHKSLHKVSPDKFKRAFRYMSRADNPDNLFLRFLRARKWDVSKALQMFGDTITWRIDFKVEEILAGGEEKAVADKDEGLIHQYKSGKATLRGHDKTGRPIVDVHVKLHDPKAQSEASIERFTILLIEASRLCVKDPVDTAAVIFDLTDFTLSNMDYSAVKFIISCFEKHYPESLGFLFIHNAPWIFQSVWNVIKGWIDPVVAAKISFTRNYDDLAKLIDPDQIPKALGGSREFEFKYLDPVPGENDRLRDNITREKIQQERDVLFDQLEELTMEWIKTPPSEKDTSIQSQRDELIEKLRENYWSMDPYVRARSVYDRDGTLAEFEPLLSQPDLEYAAKNPAPEVVPISTTLTTKSEETKVETTTTAPAAVTA